MHYPLHITVLCTALWILRDDVNAAKAGVSPEVLTSFAKNIASVLSSTLLSEWQDTALNQTVMRFPGSSKKTLGTQLLQKDDTLDTGTKIREVSRKLTKRQAVERRQSLREDGKGFQDAYVTPDAARYPKHYNPEPYRFTLSHGPEIARGKASIGTPENLNNDDRGNSIDGDINAAALRYQNGYQHSPGFKFKPDLVPPLAHSSNQYLPYGFNPHYHHHHQTPATSHEPPEVAGIDTNGENDGNLEPVRGLAERYNLNYRDSYYAPHRSRFNNHPSALYPHRQVAENQLAPGNERDAENPSRLNEDQNPGQSVLGGYGYPAKFFYGPFHDGFYGSPYFYPGPYNGSFPHGDFGHPEGNFSGPFPPGPHGPFHGFGPYFPYPPFHRNNNGKPEQPQNSPENAAQTEAESGNNDNNQGNDKDSGNNYNGGYPFHGPFYGGAPFYKYPSFPIVPYKGFGPVFFDPLVPKIKPFPYFHGHPEPFVPFPLIPYYPFPKFHYNNGQPHQDPEKPQATPAEKAVDGSKSAEPPVNSDAEVISEGQSEIVESLASDRQQFLFPWRIRSVKSVCKECSSDAGDKVSEE
ncbi:uncharacterized protein LOC143174514 isoform X2 [Nomia melanderi]|uniref:uncharacterized protein LOC143174514 isoform X2 n=1 Tax=Nomia melanderi TaxID=2448451 RepID=UPI003FCD4EEA